MTPARSSSPPPAGSSQHASHERVVGNSLHGVERAAYPQRESADRVITPRWVSSNSLSDPRRAVTFPPGHPARWNSTTRRCHLRRARDNAYCHVDTTGRVGGSDACRTTPVTRRGGQRVGSYEDIFRASTDDPEAFWLGAAEGIDWYTAPTRALDASRPPFYRWFPDGELNVCHNALDRHVDAGRGGQAALIYDSPVTGTTRTYTYAELRDEVARFAGVLTGLGVGKGDRVVVYMPMVPEAAVAMLACARIGAVHSVVFGGFAPKELAVRIDDAAPKVIVSASCGIEGKRVIEYKPLLDKADRARRAQAVEERDPAAPAGRGRDGPERRGLGGGGGRGHARRLRAREGHRPALHPLHLRHDREAQGRGPRQRRLRGGAELVDAQHLRRRPRRDDVHRVRRRVGRRALLHRLRAAAGRRHDDPLRGQAGRHARRRAVLAGDERVRREEHVHRAHRVPGDQEGGPRGRAREEVRPLEASVPLPRGRAARPRDLPLGLGTAGHPGDRPLVADRDGLADRRQPRRASSCSTSSPARPRSRCPAGMCRCSTRAAGRWSPARTARSS